MSEVQRALGRKQRVIKTLSMGAYAKLVGVLVSFAIVPLAIEYLGVENYGLWVAVSSLIAMLSFVDGGAGNALVNMVSHATGVNSNKSLQTIVSSGFFVLLAIAIMGALLFLLVYGYVPWDWVFGLSRDTNMVSVQWLVLLVGLAFFMGMPFSVVGNVQRGFQEGHIQAFWDAKGKWLSLLFSYLSIEMDLGLLGFACGFVAGPIVAQFANSIYYFYIKRTEISPTFSKVTKDEVKAVLGIGGLFFVLQITAALQSQGDNIIIANMLGPAAVPQYAICMQLFMVVPMVMALFWAPLWPAYREALASGDAEWVYRVFIKSVKLAFFVGIPSAAMLIFFGANIIKVWVGNEVLPSSLLLFGCGIWLILVMLGNSFAVLLNALQLIRMQIYIAVAAGLVNILSTIIFIKYYGVAGAVYGSILSYILCAVIPCTVMLPSILGNIKVRKGVE